MTFSHHSHSGQFCAHAKNTLEEMVQSAIANGMETRLNGTYAKAGPGSIHRGGMSYKPPHNMTRQRLGGQADKIIYHVER